MMGELAVMSAPLSEFHWNVNWFLLGHGYLGPRLISHLCSEKENNKTTVLETVKKKWKEWRATNLSPIISLIINMKDKQ